MRKITNSHKSSKFQQFKDNITSNLPHRLVIQDIDLIRLKNNKVKSIIEVKKSFSENWKPYVKANYPELSLERLDDPNYKALFKLAQLISANVIVFYYIESKLTQLGIKPFKLLDEKLHFLEYRFANQAEIQNILQQKSMFEVSTALEKRHEVTYKDQQNPNIINNEQNIYAWLGSNSITKQFYYVENKGTWTMLMSDGTNFEPIWLYIELDLENSNIDLDSMNDIQLSEYFFPQIDIHNTTQIPFSIIGHTSNLNNFYVLEYNNAAFERSMMDRQEFIHYYSLFVKRATKSSKYKK